MVVLNHTAKGVESEVGKYPWIVSLRERATSKKPSNHYCAGAILNTWWIITANHCKFNIEKDEVVISTHYR